MGKHAQPADIHTASWRLDTLDVSLNVTLFVQQPLPTTELLQLFVEAN
jgi:hypothetical protein